MTYFTRLQTTLLSLFILALSLQAGFVKRDGAVLKKDGQEIVLNGICFGNLYEHEEISDPNEYWYIDLKNSHHHDEDDFQRVVDLNMNSIRFGLNGDWYVKYKDAGRESEFWEWFDDNLTWAENKGLLLIIDMHLSPGDNWLDQSGDDETQKQYIWNNATHKNSLLELWGKIAQRYAERECIAAYDIVNEPVTTDATGAQWTNGSTGLAQKLIDKIRSHDTNHLILVEPLYGTNEKFSIPEGTAIYPTVTDALGGDNLIFDFHFYEPGSFTHQASTWTSDMIGVGGTYPDYYDFPEAYNYNTLWKYKTGDYRAVYTGNSTDWVTKTGSEYSHTTDDVVFLNVEFEIVSNGYNLTKDADTKVYMDNLKFFEVDPDGNEKEIKYSNVIDDEISMWMPWACFEKDVAGYDAADYVTVHEDNDGTGAADGDASLILNHMPDVSNFSTTVEKWLEDSWYGGKAGLNLSRSYFTYRARKDHKYYVSFQAKGNCTAGTEVRAVLRTYDKNVDGEANPSYLFRNKELMQHWFDKKVALFKAQYDGYPLSVTEFGVDRIGTLETQKGGLTWVKDFYDILKSEGVNCYTFWAYHNYAMGLYANPDIKPEECKNTYPYASDNHDANEDNYSYYPRGEVQVEMIDLLTRENSKDKILNLTTKKWYSDLRTAIEEAASYETVRIRAGEKFELSGDIYITSTGVTIEGSSTAPSGYPEITGGKLIFTHSRITLRRMKLDGISLNEHGPTSVIEDCIFTNSGVSFAMINYSTIQNCTFSNGANIQIWAGRGNRILNNVINGTGTESGVIINGNSLQNFSVYTEQEWRELDRLDNYRTHVTHNTIKNCKVGIECQGIAVVKARNSVITDCETGVKMNNYSTADYTNFSSVATPAVGGHGGNASYVEPDLAASNVPCSGSPVIDAGVVLEGINDGFYGSAPDLGAKEQLPPAVPENPCDCDVVFEEDFEGFVLDSNLLVRDNWDIYVDAAATAETWILDPTFSGNKEAHFFIGNDGDETWSVHYRNKGIELEKNSTYKVTFSARTESGYERDINVMLQQDLVWTDYSKAPVVTIDETMQEYSFTFTMEHTSDFNAVLLFEMGDFSEYSEVPLDVVLDDIQITKVHE